MTFKQLEQYLKTERFRAGAERGTDMCGRYARCEFCDRLSAYPCAYAYDAFVKSKKEVPAWQIPEPPVKERFGTEFADGEPAREKTHKTEKAYLAEPEHTYLSEAPKVATIAEKAESAEALEAVAQEEKVEEIVGEEESEVVLSQSEEENESVEEAAEESVEDEESVRTNARSGKRGVITSARRSDDAIRILTLKRRNG